jgi:NAD(P)-dependent dehydrogenase (short-subunit alcohol dehydrogenase family)
MGARVILACRNPARGEAARAEIAADTGSRALDLHLVDFSEQASIRAFASEVLASYDDLHVLVNNAGLWSATRRHTPEGLELTWATNALGYFLTTRLLLDRLIDSGSARIVNVASNLARDLDLDDLGFERRPYSGVLAYAQSKQANRMLTWALARRLQGTGVTANAVHPGGVRTGIFRKGGTGVRGWLVANAARLVGMSPRRGADTALWLASSPDVEGKSGLYYFKRKVQVCPFRDEAREERLWARCEEMTAG